MREAYHALQSEILGHLAGPGGEFEDLALRIFRFQFDQNPPYRAYCEALGLTPDLVHRWEEIPPAPTEAFKGSAPLSCHPPQDCQRLFLTSGTTEEVRGRHYLRDTTLYQASVRQGWTHAGLPTGLRPFFLSLPPTALPHSSLACMFEFLAPPADTPAWLLTESGTIETDPLDGAIASGEPILLFSTALALRHFFQLCPEGRPLPAGSWVFQTGGYKGLAETLDSALLYQSIHSQLAVPQDRVINEYGMTELSSASYSVGLGTAHHPPPWLRVRTIHPETNLPNPPGQAGHLVFCDLANLNSVVAVRTRDLGAVHDDHTFVLEGRDPSAPPRGCSRASDAFLQRS